jgi:hypothetical protein
LKILAIKNPNPEFLIIEKMVSKFYMTGLANSPYF